MSLVLIIEDDLELAITTEMYLQKEGFRTFILGDGRSAVKVIKQRRPDVVLLDLSLPGKDGLSICREVTEQFDTPIIITTASVDEIDRLTGFEVGAVDYVCKPYSPREVVARVSVWLRHHCKDSVISDPVVVDESSLTVRLNGSSIHLSKIEFNIFRVLYDLPQKIFSRQNLIEAIYQDFRQVSFLTINSHVRNLRKKLNKISPEHELIRSVYSVGYRYEVVPTPKSLATKYRRGQSTDTGESTH